MILSCNNYLAFLQVRREAYFEDWMLETDGESPYGVFLKRCLHCLDVNVNEECGIRFETPYESLICAYMAHLHGLGLLYSTIEAYTAALFSTASEMKSGIFSHVFPSDHPSFPAIRYISEL